MRIRDLGDGRNFEFLFFRDGKIDEVSRIEEKRNLIRAASDGVEFSAFSDYASVGTVDRSTHRIKITVEKNGDLTVTVTCAREERAFWILGGTKTQTFVLKMTRLPESCEVPPGAESFPPLDVEGPRSDRRK